MRSLVHLPLDPQSRFIRLVLAEKGLVARLVEISPASGAEELARLNPAMSLPVLVDEPPTGGEVAIAPASAIAEFLEEAYDAYPLLPKTSASRAETRRLASWFNDKFEKDVNSLIVRRRIEHRTGGRRWGEPEPIRDMANGMKWHLDYLSYLLEQRGWLAGDKMSLADLAGAAHLSASDYFGFVPWPDFPEVKAWYERIKSRPSMRPLLADRIESANPPPHYGELDF